MKCPKCGYLGFETTDRCRNCQYDFSLSTPAADPELALQDTDRQPESNSDFDLSSIARPADSITPSSLDLDRLFGAETPAPPAARPPAITVAEPVAPAPEPPIEISIEAIDEPAADPSALPFDDVPISAPPAARQPLAVRRTTPEIPRNRSRAPRPAKAESELAFDSESTATGPDATARSSAGEMAAALAMAPPLAVRVGAGLIDLLLLAAIDAIVVALTLRMAELQMTADDLRVLPPIPFLAFLGLLGFGYVALFTVAGGQTIGKMLLKLRVIGDDGRPVDAAGGMLRAAGCMLVPMTLGLSYVPALFTADHRALHDRLAGTRVVRE
jgi:uncharacterized RDD family membrane protein YckC